MGLNSSQLNHLDRQIDENRTELVILSREDAVHLAASNEARQGPCIPLKVCSRSQNWMLDGIRGATQPLYNDSLHQLVNTNWGSPALLAVNDAYDLTLLLKNIGGIGTQIRYSTYKGQQYVILTGRPGLRQILKGTRYGIRNAQLVEFGIGQYGIRGSSLAGLKLSCYVAVGIEVLEWFFSDEATVADLLGGIFVELVKAGIGTAIGYAVATLVAGVTASAAMPLIAGAAVIFAVGIALNVIDNDLEIKATVKASLNYAVEHIQQMTENIQIIDTRSLERYKNDVINSITDAIIDTAFDEAKSWLFDKIPSQLIPSTPDFSWPKAPSLPHIPNFNLPRF
ncbi:hypothetical protein N8H41_13205 [Pseudomonas vlassakiae]|uniref:hypothetical protein n=1 Tax=Pseudomonas vlassakiae TaxID=485888 RepID=UPI0021C6B894|nr:hypothetical protein [Pseudomonas vlassakiae]MCU0124929.1 hypothetical protein [Pseudomonas vlassakiae]